MKDINLNLLRDKAYEIAKNNGFHEEEVSEKHCLVLVISELIEALEAYRKGNCLYENEDKYMDVQSKINDCYNNSEVKECFKKYIKDTFEDELADTVIRLLDLAGYKDFDVVPECLKTIDVRNKSIPEHIFTMISNLSSDFYLSYRIDYCIKYIFELSEEMGIDILWHIDVKMAYNELREYKHGKRF